MREGSDGSHLRGWREVEKGSTRMGWVNEWTREWVQQRMPVSADDYQDFPSCLDEREREGLPNGASVNPKRGLAVRIRCVRGSHDCR